jgi:hypothetical protein
MPRFIRFSTVLENSDSSGYAFKSKARAGERTSIRRRRIGPTGERVARYWSFSAVKGSIWLSQSWGCLVPVRV